MIAEWYAEEVEGSVFRVEQDQGRAADGVEKVGEMCQMRSPELHCFGGELVGLVQREGDGLHLFLGKGPDLGAQLLMRLGGLE